MKDELGGSPHVFLLTIFFFGRLVQQVVPCGVVFLEFFDVKFESTSKKSVQNDNAIEVRDSNDADEPVKPWKIHRIFWSDFLRRL